MTSPADVLVQARARSATPARQPQRSPSLPPEDRDDPRAELGYTHAPKPRPSPARAVVEDVSETGDPLFGPWCATVRKADGKRLWTFGATEADALRKARARVEGRR